MADVPDFKPRFSSQISLGNVVTIIGGIIAAATAWANLDGRVTEIAKMTAASAARIEGNSARIRSNELAITRQDERTNSILSGIARIEGQLARLNKRMDMNGWGVNE